MIKITNLMFHKAASSGIWPKFVDKGKLEVKRIPLKLRSIRIRRGTRPESKTHWLVDLDVFAKINAWSLEFEVWQVLWCHCELRGPRLNIMPVQAFHRLINAKAIAYLCGWRWYLRTHFWQYWRAEITDKRGVSGAWRFGFGFGHRIRRKDSDSKNRHSFCP